MHNSLLRLFAFLFISLTLVDAEDDYVQVYYINTEDWTIYYESPEVAHGGDFYLDEFYIKRYYFIVLFV